MCTPLFLGAVPPGSRFRFVWAFCLLLPVWRAATATAYWLCVPISRLWQTARRPYETVAVTRKPSCRDSAAAAALAARSSGCTLPGNSCCCCFLFCRPAPSPSRQWHWRATRNVTSQKRHRLAPAFPGSPSFLRSNQSRQRHLAVCLHCVVDPYVMYE